MYVSRIRFDAGLPGFNPDWNNRDTGCEFPPKVQLGLSFGALECDPGTRYFINRTLYVYTS